MGRGPDEQNLLSMRTDGYERLIYKPFPYPENPRLRNFPISIYGRHVLQNSKRSGLRQRSPLRPEKRLQKRLFAEHRFSIGGIQFAL
jgi:hypothetical protein